MVNGSQLKGPVSEHQPLELDLKFILQMGGVHILKLLKIKLIVY